MLAPGDVMEGPEDLVRESGEATREDRAVDVDLTMSQAMNGGKWKLLAWLENRGEAGSARP